MRLAKSVTGLTTLTFYVWLQSNCHDMSAVQHYRSAATLRRLPAEAMAVLAMPLQSFVLAANRGIDGMLPKEAPALVVIQIVCEAQANRCSLQSSAL